MRAGFSLIEAIASIVVLGIILLAVPSLILTSQNANKTAILQQGIMDSKVVLALVINLPWGCAKNEIFDSLQIMPIFAKNLDNFYTKNEIEISTQRRYFADLDTSKSCEKSAGIKSIDDADGLNFTAKSTNANGSETVSQMKLEISQISPNNEPNEHIKEIKIINKIKLNGLEQNITLRGYAVNIGSTPKILTKKIK